MKKIGSLLLVSLCIVCLSACAFLPLSAQETVYSAAGDAANDAQQSLPASDGNGKDVSDTDISVAESEEQAMTQQNTFYVKVGGETFSATFADNSGAKALQELLADGDLTIQMSDYGGFEKVGSLGQTLPTENSQTTTRAGDIVLYQGSQIVIFYGSNSWSYTRLGKIDDLTRWGDALGSGDVAITLSLSAQA